LPNGIAEVVLKKKVNWHTIKQANNITMLEEEDIPRGVLRLLHGGLNLSRGQIGKEEEDNTKESEEDNNSDGTHPNKVNTVPGPKELRNQKQAQLHKGQPSILLEGVGDMPTTVATSINGLLSTETTMTIEAANIDLGTSTMKRPSSPFVVDFKLQLEAKEVAIACLQEDVQKLLRETKEKNLVIAKQVLEIQHLCRQQSHAFIVDDIQESINVEAHAHQHASRQRCY
jgi:hypothetical protein